MHKLCLALAPLFLAACASTADEATTPPSVDPEFQVIAIQHLEVEELAETLAAFLADANQVNGETWESGPKVLADQRTNSLLVMAQHEHFEQIHALVQNLDKPQ